MFPRAGARRRRSLNLTFDWVCPDDLKDQVPIVGGSEMDFRYGDLQAEMDLINRAYMEVMTAGDAKGRVFTFPIPTYNIIRDFPWDSDNATRLFEMTAKYGLPLLPELPQFRADAQHGALHVLPSAARSPGTAQAWQRPVRLCRANGIRLASVTVNCARLGYLHRDDETGLLRRLDDLLAIGRTSLEIKRKTIERLMADGLFPYTKRYLGTLRNHFSTLGLNGVNEMIRKLHR